MYVYLFSQSVFVSPDSLDNGAVEEEDESHGQHVAEEESEEHVALGIPGLRQVVVRAGVQQALGGESTPDVQQGRQRDADGVAPDGGQDGHGLARGDLNSRES